MKFIDRMKERYGVSVWGVLAILASFALAGLTVVRVKGPLLSLLLPDDAEPWLKWVVYLLVVFPVYQLLLLMYGTLLGQFRFFWGKLKLLGRLLSGRRAA